MMPKRENMVVNSRKGQCSLWSCGKSAPLFLGGRARPLPRILWLRLVQETYFLLQLHRLAFQPMA